MVKRRHGSKKVSRNKKAYWRKGADVAAVESFVESIREDERLGVKEKSDSDLYFVQKQPSLNNSEDNNSIVRCLKKVELKCFQNLKNNSAVKPLIKQAPSVKVTQKKQETKLTKSAKRISRSNKRMDPEPETVIHDLWDNDLKSASSSLQPDLEDYYLRQTKKRLPNVPRTTRQLTTKLPTVEAPHPGQSYNPTFSDHQALLNAAADVEVKKLSIEEKLQRKLKVNGEIATKFSKFAELAEGLNITKTENEDSEDSDEETPLTSVAIRRRPVSAEDRKLGVKKRKQLLDKLKKIQKGEEKQKKKRLNEVYRLRTITKEIKAEEEAIARKIQRNVALKEEKFYKPAVLGRHRYQEPDLELNLPDEVPGSLRLMKAEGNVLEDRYKSLQRRNVVDTRVFYTPAKRKYRLKKFEKRDCREVTADYIPRH